MLGRKKAQRDLLESFGIQKVSPEHFLMKLEKLIDWEMIEIQLEGLYPSREGRPSYPPLVMFKALLLAQFYHLSDPELEEQVRDRLSFQKFLGLSITEQVPDETTYCRFRARLNEAGLTKRLFEHVNRGLAKKGLMLKKGSIVDASIIESPHKDSDTQGRWTVKRDKPYFGYKMHVSCETDNQLIQDVEVTPANTSDTKVMEKILPEGVEEVYADKAYDNFQRRYQFKRKGIFYGILRRQWRNQSLDEVQKEINRQLSKVRSQVERVFAHLKDRYGYRQVRYRGLAQNQTHGYLLAIAYNLKRALSLVEVT